MSFLFVQGCTFDEVVMVEQNPTAEPFHKSPESVTSANPLRATYNHDVPTFQNEEYDHSHNLRKFGETLPPFTVLESKDQYADYIDAKLVKHLHTDGSYLQLRNREMKLRKTMLGGWCYPGNTGPSAGHWSINASSMEHICLL